jgi:hypothetical protein
MGSFRQAERVHLQRLGDSSLQTTLLGSACLLLTEKEQGLFHHLAVGSYAMFDTSGLPCPPFRVFQVMVSGSCFGTRPIIFLVHLRCGLETRRN